MVKCYYFSYFSLIDDTHHNFVSSDLFYFIKELKDVINSDSFLISDIGGFHHVFN